MRVQMLDNDIVNNNFYRDLLSDCAEPDQAQLMALELQVGARIHMSALATKGCRVSNNLSFTQNR